MTRFKTDPNAAEGVESIAPVKETRRENDGWSVARLWDSLDMDGRYDVLCEAGLRVDRAWWNTCVPEYTTYDQLMYDVLVKLGPVLKKRLKSEPEDAVKVKQ